MNCFELHHMTFAPTQTAILNDINLDIPWGIDLTIAGHSGSGKSTLLRLLATLLTPTNGTILYNGKAQADYDPIGVKFLTAPSSRHYLAPRLLTICGFHL